MVFIQQYCEESSVALRRMTAQLATIPPVIAQRLPQVLCV
ncbi:hypothetical protein BRCON_0308 [Candidatus Sumerlaea chitinivorans]|uniref:Uncharacterized protein n=1 Tax=Sumerlaea chitinivorans TaxID=2250252 RepID=A0A2Z4Y3P5_SUMC1|nr:hypothetical protein BRCON_0308 [Candidatus Sumerlaea chitinivorans]